MNKLLEFLSDVESNSQTKLDDTDFERGSVGDILKNVKRKKEKIAIEAGFENDPFDVIEVLLKNELISVPDYEVFKRNKAAIATLYCSGVETGVAVCADVAYDMSRVFEIINNIENKKEHDEQKS